MACLKKNYSVTKKHLACIFVIFCVCCQIRAAIRKMSLGNSTGPCSKPVKLLGHLKTIELIRSQHYSTKSMTQVRFHQTFPNPYLWHCQKKPGAAECELHIMNSFMSHITTILLRMIMMWVRNKTKPEIAEEQWREKRYNKSNLYSWTMIEPALEAHKEVYLCFIDYTEAFDKIRHGEIITKTHLKIDGKDLRAI